MLEGTIPPQGKGSLPGKGVCLGGRQCLRRGLFGGWVQDLPRRSPLEKRMKRGRGALPGEGNRRTCLRMGRGMPAALTGSGAAAASGSRGTGRGEPPRPAPSREAFHPSGRSPRKRCFVFIYLFPAFKPVLPNTQQLQIK